MRSMQGAISNRALVLAVAATMTATFLIGAQPASAQEIPLGDSRVAVRLSHLKGADSLEVAAGKGWNTNTFTEWICVFASRQSRGERFEERGCVEEDALNGASYDFDQVGWTASAKAKVPTRVYRLAHVNTACHRPARRTRSCG